MWKNKKYRTWLYGVALFGLVTTSINNSYCQNPKVIVENVSPRYSIKECRVFIDSIVLKGDVLSYAQYHFLRGADYPKHSNGSYNDYEHILPYALIMANRYNYAPACFQIYLRTKELYEYYNMEMDKETHDFIMHYLVKGAQLGYEECIRLLEMEKKGEDKDVSE
ncbi:MAG: hypothetical protein J6X86_00675 [Bacteroidales bacterium]|nr:hypothetical protein [Bacteroidales bacterium]